MLRQALVILCAAGCGAGAADVDPAAPAAQTAPLERAAPFGASREHVVDDIYHYQGIVRLGDGPSAALRVHRIVREGAPWMPRPTRHAAMLLHGDFATFVTDFAPGLGSPASPVRGLAPYLAAHDIDVWGVDRRWTLPGAAADVSDFATMGVAQEVDDLRSALTLARTLRQAGGSGGDKLALVGFSHGAQLAYVYAAIDAARPPGQRLVGALVPLDFYGDYAPEQADDRAAACANSQAEYQLVGGGTIDSPNDFLITAGQLARSAPSDPSPLIDGLTNRAVMRLVVGQTYQFAPLAPFYHLLAPILGGDAVVGLRETSEAAATAWLAGAPPHQSMLEAADLDALLCGEGALPVDAPLARIRVPLLYVGAAGGVGALGLHATTQVSSTDVTTLVVHRFGPGRRAEDFGHADLLFAADARTLAWQPLAAWLSRH